MTDAGLMPRRSAQEVAAGRCLEALDVLVLAGGLGTRLQAALGDTPKLLAPIAGKPYLAYLLAWLGRFGARRVVLGLGHLAEAVRAYLARTPMPGFEIVPVVEPRPLGTAGAVRFARGALRTDPALVMNGDSLVDADLCALLLRHRAARALGTILCTEVEDAGRYGRIALDRDGRIERFVEKDPACRGAATVSAGVYALSAQLLDEIAAGSARSLEQEVFQHLPAGTLAALSGRYRFIDIGTPDSLARAAEVLVRPPVPRSSRGLRRS